MTKNSGSILAADSENVIINKTIPGTIKFEGPASQVEDLLSRLKFKPGCIFDNNSLVIDIVIWSAGNSIISSSLIN